MRSATGGLCFIFMISAANMLNLLQKDGNTFGPYDINWTQYHLCKGPKSRNDTAFFTNVTKDDASSIGYFNFTILSDVTFTEIKISVYSLTNSSKNLLWTYKISDPCKHFAIAPLIYTYLKTNTCLIKKASYYDVSIRFDDIAYAFFGSSFFYGDYSLKVTCTSKQGNILCLSFVMNITKKNIEKKVQEEGIE